VVFATVDSNGIPNAIWVGSAKKISKDKILLTDNYFNKTRANILGGSKGALLFITDEHKSFQVKGSIDYLKSGEIYDNMKAWLKERSEESGRPELPGVAATVLNVEEVYSGAEKLL